MLYNARYADTVYLRYTHTTHVAAHARLHGHVRTRAASSVA